MFVYNTTYNYIVLAEIVMFLPLEISFIAVPSGYKSDYEQ